MILPLLVDNHNLSQSCYSRVVVQLESNVHLADHAFLVIKAVNSLAETRKFLIQGILVEDNVLRLCILVPANREISNTIWAIKSSISRRIKHRQTKPSKKKSVWNKQVFLAEDSKF